MYTVFIRRTPLKMSGSRKDMEQWMDFLTECYWRELAVKDLSHVDRLWILAPVTGCPSVSHEVPSDLLPSTKWVTLAGHFQSIESASGITWALGHDNSIWIWVGCYPDKSGTERRIQTDTCTVDLYENQRWNPMAGFSSTLLPSDRYISQLWSTFQFHCQENTISLHLFTEDFFEIRNFDSAKFWKETLEFWTFFYSIFLKFIFFRVFFHLIFHFSAFFQIFFLIFFKFFKFLKRFRIFLIDQWYVYLRKKFL